MYYIVKRNSTDDVSLFGGQINDVKEGENGFFLMYYIKDIL